MLWGLLAAVLWGIAVGGLGTLGLVLFYAERHPGALIRAAFEHGLDQSERADGGRAAPKP